MIAPTLQREIEKVARRRRDRQRSARLAILGGVTTLAACVLVGLAFAGQPVLLPVFGLMALAVVAGLILLKPPTQNPTAIARLIESAHPELAAALLTAVEQEPEVKSGQLNYLQRRVIAEAVRAAQGEAWSDVEPSPRIWKLNLALVSGFGLAALALLVAVTVNVVHRVRGHAAPETDAYVTVDPGDTKVERGHPLTVLARFKGPLPAEATLVTIGPKGERRSIPLARSLEDPTFAATLPAVTSDLHYLVEHSRGRSAEFKVEIFDQPAIESAEAILHSPAYTGLPDKKIEDPTVLTAVEQTEMELAIEANHPMASVELRSPEGEAIELEAVKGKPARYGTRLTLNDSRKYEVVLTDADGRTARRTLEVKVRKNEPPVVTTRLPFKGDRVHQLQEVALEAEVKDDFGLRAAGLVLQISGHEPTEVPLENLPAGTRRQSLRRVLALEAESAQPNDIVTWHAWGEDLGPDGRPRRVNGDVNITQVRHFDERYFQQRAAGSGGMGGEGTQLIKVQTEVLQSSWNIQRDGKDNPKNPPEKTLPVVRDGQQAAIDLAGNLRSRLPDAEARSFLDAAIASMGEALEPLKTAAEKTALEPVAKAIPHERTALEHLYRLLGSDFMLVQGAEGQSASEGGGLQMDDVEMKSMEQRYELESQAAPEEEQQAGEIREMLARLSDLAREQRDLNEMIKSLQMASANPRSEEEAAALKRQLERLRDRQSELVAAMDRLRSKTEESESRTASQEQRKTMEEARETARQARRELDRTKMGEALAAGARTAEKLERLEQEFREKQAGELTTQMRELRRQSREMNDEQEKLARSLAQESGALERRTLRDQPGEDSPARLAAAQAERMEALLKNVGETAAGARLSEPLLSTKLEEALRAAAQQETQRALEGAEVSARVGDREGARAQVEQASEGVEELAKNLEEAAESVLGSEEKALEFAQAELGRLARAVQSSGPGESPGEEGERPSSQPGESGQGQGGSQDQPGQQGQGQGEGREPGQGQGQGTGENGSGTLARDSGTNDVLTADSPSFLEWTDRLVNLEAIVELPSSRAALSRARRAARELRVEYRESKTRPQPELVISQVLGPLLEARSEIDRALSDLQRTDPLAPVERDAVPEAYAEVVRRYYEELGR